MLERSRRLVLTGLSLATISLGLLAATPARADDPAAPAALKIMPLGDSITMGIGSATTSSYRVDLQHRRHQRHGAAPRVPRHRPRRGNGVQTAT